MSLPPRFLDSLEKDLNGLYGKSYGWDATEGPATTRLFGE
jgi:hypothetical protein